MRPAWVQKQIGDFVAGFSGGGAVLIGIKDIDSLHRAYLTAPGAPPARLVVVANLPLAEGFVWYPPPGRGLPQLWLAPTKTGYRAAFERFAQRELGAAGLDGANVQIDHVFPKKAGILGGLNYVRMLAVPPDSNMAAGRTLEKKMVARNEELGARGKATRTATHFSIGKATGFAGYDRLPDDGSAPQGEIAAQLFAHLRAFGLPPSVLNSWDQDLTARRVGTLR